MIDRVPRTKRLRGECDREFMLNHAQERLFLEMAEQPLRAAALLMLDTGLRIGRLRSMEWPDVHLNPIGGARFGYFHIRKGKSLMATRKVILIPRVPAMLKSRQTVRRSVWFFCRWTRNRVSFALHTRIAAQSHQGIAPTACGCRDTLVSAYVRNTAWQSWGRCL